MAKFSWHPHNHITTGQAEEFLREKLSNRRAMKPPTTPARSHFSRSWRSPRPAIRLPRHGQLSRESAGRGVVLPLEESR